MAYFSPFGMLERDCEVICPIAAFKINSKFTKREQNH